MSDPSVDRPGDTPAVRRAREELRFLRKRPWFVHAIGLRKDDLEAILEERDFLDEALRRVAEAAGVETPLQLTALAESDEETTADLLVKHIRGHF